MTHINNNIDFILCKVEHPDEKHQEYLITDDALISSELYLIGQEIDEHMINDIISYAQAQFKKFVSYSEGEFKMLSGVEDIEESVADFSRVLEYAFKRFIKQ